MTLVDSYGRPLLNLRVIVTDECNYRCVFCHIEGEPLKSPIPPGLARKLGYLTIEEYELIADAAREVGIEKIKFTGGEPLLRDELPRIISAFSSTHSFKDISMTTNGYLLKEQAGKLREAGLDRLNISLHTLRPDVYRFITGINGLEKVMAGLNETLEHSYRQVKINVVVLKNVNDKEIPELIEFSADKGLVLQLIELHPVGMAKEIFHKYFVPLDYIEEYLRSRASKISLRTDLHNRPLYLLDNGVLVEVVRPYNNWKFCMGCTRIRLSPIGELFPCINWFGPRPNIRNYIRGKENRNEKIQAIVNAIKDVNGLRRPYYKPPYMSSDSVLK